MNIHLSDSSVEFGVCDSNYVSLLQYYKHYPWLFYLIAAFVWLVSVIEQNRLDVLYQSKVWKQILIQEFFYILLFSTLYNNSEDIKTMK